MENKKGSMLVAVLMVFFVLSLISLAIIERSIQDVSIVTQSKQGHEAYQGSDAGAEKILNEIKLLEKNTENKIPENQSALDFCSKLSSEDAKVKCFVWKEKKSEENVKLVCSDTEISNGSKVSDICKIKQDFLTQNKKSKRAIEVPITWRTMNIIDKNSLKIENCSRDIDGCDHPNQCDLKISWEITDKMSADTGGFEIRRSNQGDLGNSDNYGWRIALGTGQKNQSIKEKDGKYYFILENGDEKLSPPGSQYDFQDYYFTIKTKNKNNFELDSLFNAPVNFDKMPNKKSCLPIFKTYAECFKPGEEPPGASLIKTANYTCCDGKECYEYNPESSSE